ncbi:hypothetical protein [Allochromatium palmeri]|uniref:Uncharacterized protein n=1 Tax=Allochromatium palmeri TaxID=231048 RepID=A0A6N8EHZ6_9GAMM|nr:hypothetical protein [Allochromatium palmeri]MTW23241.1 hypothetical protein [Allochromatium palmeri]
MRGTRRVMLDSPAYFRTLGWLGKTSTTGEAAWLERPLPWGDWDARGSWPYQSLPSETLLQRLYEAEAANGQRLLTWTGVIRPDQGLAKDVNDRLKRLASHCASCWRPLKEHLGHVPDRPSARQHYSARTRRRLREAQRQLQVELEPLSEQHRCIATWQEALRRLRGIPRASSPDAAHFEGLIQLATEYPTALPTITLRHRSDGTLGGLCLAVQDASDSPSWHLHSLFCDARARKSFGAYTLFDTAIECWGAEPIWWGGQPATAEGVGIWRFKQRFSNASAPAHLLCLELDPTRLREIRASRPLYAWLPDYRDPVLELLV